MKLGVLYQFCSNAIKHQSSGIIVIGNEILNAQISVIEDNIDDITREIKNFSEQFTHVITSGGIGPTHDDVTFEGLARAFGNSLQYNPTLMDIIKNKFGIKDPSSPALKLALIPEEATLEFGTNEETGELLLYPCIRLRNVYVFPGSPHFLRASFGSLCKKLFHTNSNFVSTELYIDAKEETFADALTKISKEFPSIKFGSYPQNSQSFYKARVTIVGDDVDEMEKAKERFKNLIPLDILIDHDQISLRKAAASYENFVRDCQRYFLYDNTLRTLRNLYTNSKEVAIYFDGSTQSTVLLHLVHIIKTTMKINSKLQMLSPNFDTTTSKGRFIRDVAKRYDAELTLLEESLLASSLNTLTISNPNIKTVLFGFIFDDENNNEMSEFMKNETVELLNLNFPLLNWSRSDVQTFAKIFLF